MDEVTKATSAENQERQLTDKELEAILKQSEGKTDFPQVTFDEFTPPTYEEWVDVVLFDYLYHFRRSFRLYICIMILFYIW